MGQECTISELSGNIIELKNIQMKAKEALRFVNVMRTHPGGAEWVEIKVISGKAFIRTLLKIEGVIAVADNYAAANTQYPEHTHPAHEIFIVYEGDIDLTVNDKRVKVCKPGKPYYFDGRSKHSAFFPIETSYIAITIPDDSDWPDDGYTK